MAASSEGSRMWATGEREGRPRENTTAGRPTHLTSPRANGTLAEAENGSMDSWVDKVAVITGGASGIGRELCLAFARAGARIVVADLDERGMADTVAAAAAAAGRRATAVRTDVSRLADVEALAE